MDVLEARNHLTDLTNHMYRMYKDNVFCDVDITSQDGKTFNAHKLVLTASSAYLYNWSMHSPQAISLHLDFHSDVLHILLEFCYTGKLILACDQWNDVLFAASFLQMQSVLDLDLLCNTASADVTESQGVIVNNAVGRLQTQNEAVTERDSQKDVIIKQEVINIHDEAENQSEPSKNRNQSGISTRRLGTRPIANSDCVTKYNRVRPGTRSRVKQQQPGHTDSEEKITRRSRSKAIVKENKTSYNNKLGKKSDLDNDPDYIPVRKKKHKSQTLINTRRRGKNSDVTSKKVQLDEDKGRITLKIQSKPLKKTSQKSCKRNSEEKAISKIFIPQNSDKKCSLCKKSFQSSVMLFRHQIGKHQINCTRLRSCYVVKISKELLHWSNRFSCSSHSQTRSFTCKVCDRKFMKYSIFVRHHQIVHRRSKKSLESWLRYCSVKIIMQKLLVPFAKDRRVRLLKTVTPSQKGSRVRTFQCCDCDKMFLTDNTLRAHRRNIHGVVNEAPRARRRPVLPLEPLYVCVDCRKEHTSRQALFTHLQKMHSYSSKDANYLQHSFPDKILCESWGCTFWTNNLQKMKDHVTENHPDIRCQCSECPSSFKTSLAVKRHKFTCHSVGQYNFACQLCPKRFRKSGLLRNHEYFKHDIKHNNVKVFHCEHPDCTYKTYAASAIKLHQNKHVKEKLFPCDYCSMKLKTEKIREKHMAKMHLGIRPFLCQVCGLSFGEKHELQSHIANRHASEKCYHCQYCDYQTNVKGTFYTHVFNVHKMRVDEDKRELYKCPHCPFTSILRHRYQTHVNGHTDTRNYRCEICNKSFVSSNTLRSHNQWKHSDKTYSCRQCDYQTKTPQKLNEHVRVQHQLQGFKPYKCPYCPFRCATGGNTRKHVKQVHKNQPVTYIRDDELITAARMARASGNYASLFNTLSAVNLSQDLSQDVIEDERSELSDNVLHIVM